MFRINIPTDALAVDKRNPLFVAGQAWLEIDGEAFPEAHWTDAPLSVLGSMREALACAHEGELGEVYFFEGPFYVKFLPENTLSAERTVDVVGLRDRVPSSPGDGDEIVIRASVPLGDLVRSHQQVVGELRQWATAHAETEVLEVLALIGSADFE
ncbi:hypothetical protein ACFRMQ_22085 [Kitasatospora sp. NPDC056783]|uniref:hypothetical protein n=1 Tax=Kitasatospora sp. NPDC056783 TaxID=3345943 RepID=UPI0036CCFCBC